MKENSDVVDGKPRKIRRRSRSRTRKTNKYLLVGRDKSFSKDDTTLNPAEKDKAKGNFVIVDSSENKSLFMDYCFSCLLFFLAFILRGYNLDSPPSIVFDELVYGRHISSYLKREAFFSFDPPLALQIYSFLGLLSGDFDTTFEFSEVGKDYKNVPYLLFRITTVLVCSTLPVLVYNILRLCDCNITSAVLSSILVAIDPCLIVQSRIYTAESLVLPVQTSALLCILYHIKHKGNTNLFWLVIAGLCSGVAVSMSYSSICTILLVHLLAALDLWDKIKDIQYSKEQLWKKFIYIMVSMFILPILIYTFVWAVHFKCLKKPADYSVSPKSISSPAVQAMAWQRPVMNESVVTLSNAYGNACWLHSHELVYPERYADNRSSSGQQQVTCYPYVDSNNQWVVYRHTNPNDRYTDDKIRQGDTIALMHKSTGRYLSSLTVAAPMSINKQEVMCVPDQSLSRPAQVLWTLEMQDIEEYDVWLEKSSKIMLMHFNTSAALSVTNKQLPEWAGRQYEVVADPFTYHENVIWTADEIISSTASYPEANTSQSFLAQFFDVHRYLFMASYYYDSDHEFMSGPFDWPFGQANLIYWFNSSDSRQIHMLPNIVSWTCSALAMALLMVLLVYHDVIHCRKQRASAVKNVKRRDTDNRAALIIVLGGYFLNWVTCTFTDQQLMLSHYMKSLVFALMAVGYFFDQLCKLHSLEMTADVLSALILFASTGFTFCVSSLVYGDRVPDVGLLTMLEEMFGWKFFYDV